MKQHPRLVRESLLLAALLGCISLVQGQCDGVCVPLANCSNSFGDAVFDLRVGDDGECNHYLEVCCDNDDVIGRPGQTSGAGVRATPRPVGPPAGTDNNEQTFDNCGYRNSDGVGFRVSNALNETEFGEFPWMVAILETQVLLDRETSTFICGGSLIAPNVVLTAAHCVNLKNPESLKVRAGEWDTRTENEVLPLQERPVQKITINSNYNSALQFNDVALVTVQQPFTADEHIKLICLPPQGMLFFNDDCFATGWGKSEFNSDNYQVILKKIKLPMVAHQNCEQALRTTRLGPKFKLHNSFVCAGGHNGEDTCTGDGGSPLMCPFPGYEGRYYQAGIVAWGIGCGTPGIPGVYVKTSLYTDWINQQIIALDTDEFFANYD